MNTPNVQNFAHYEGRLVYEPQVNPTAGGQGVTNLTLEVPTGFKDHVSRLKVVAWHRDVKVPEKLKIGDYVIAEGRISARSYDDKKTPGAKVNVVEMTAESLEAPAHKRAASEPERESRPPTDDDALPF